MGAQCWVGIIDAIFSIYNFLAMCLCGLAYIMEYSK